MKLADFNTSHRQFNPSKNTRDSTVKFPACNSS